MKRILQLLTLATAASVLGAGAGFAVEPDDRLKVAALDIAYQAAVKAGDAATMDRILHADFTLVNSLGRTASREDLLTDARTGRVIWEVQDEVPGSQTVRLYGPDTAVVTAQIRLRYRIPRTGKSEDRTIWFSDTYVRTTQGWRYAFGQAAGAPSS